MHLSEAESYLRIRVARATRKDPMLLEMLADGRLHLSGIEKLAPRLTDDNRDRLLERATHQTRRGIEELVAEIAPRPDVPAAIRKLPEPRQATKTAGIPVLELRPDGAASSSVLRPDGVQPAPAPVRPAAVQPLSAGRYEVKFTASAELRDKLERLQAHKRSTVPGADLALVIEEAVSEKLERLEARRFGQTRSPRKGLAPTDTAPSSRYIPAAVKREVWQLGDRSPANLMLMCTVHNGYLAERDYGKEKMRRYRRPRDRPPAQVGSRRGSVSC